MTGPSISHVSLHDRGSSGILKSADVGEVIGRVCAHIDFGILGSTFVRMRGHPSVQPISRRRQRQALAVLLAHPHKRVSFEHLKSWIWTEHEQPPVNTAGTFHTYGRLLRRVLERCESRVKLVTEDGGFRLVVEREKIDYFAFGMLMGKARSFRDQGRHDQALESAKAAVALWRDEPLVDVKTELAEAWRRRVVRHEWLPANILLVDQQIALGKFDAALLRLDELAEDHWPEVNLVKRRIQVLQAVGQYQEVTDQYLTAYRQLGERADHEAQNDLRRFYEEIRQRTREDVRVSMPNSPVPPRQLPPDVPHFVGRSGLLTTLSELTGVAAGRPRACILALSGLAGVGKTTAVVRWAHSVARFFPDGVLFADLKGFSRTPRMEAGEVVDFFLARLGYPIEHIVGPAGRAEKLRALLGERPVLVILDNAKDSTHVRDLLPLFGACVVVITSRHRLAELGVQQGVRSLAVDPLEPGQGADLLMSRIDHRAVDDPETVQELTSLCAGLPLMLSMVAVRVANRPGAPLASIARQMRDRETLYTMGTYGDGFDSSLESVFSLSYEELTVESARLFRLLGLHPSAEFGVEVAAALSGESVSRVRRRLDELVGAHLLEQPGEVDRYQMHDLVLGYASRNADGELDAEHARRRMLSFYLHSAARVHEIVFRRTEFPFLSEPFPGCSPKSFSSEHDALNWFLSERYNINSVLYYAARSGHERHAWMLAHAVAKLLERLGFYREIINGFLVAVDCADRDAAFEAKAATHNDLGFFLIGLGDVDAAAEHLRQALDIVDGLGNPTAALTVKMNLALLQREKGNLREAVRLYQDCLDEAIEIGDRERQAKAEHNLGLVFCAKSDYAAAVEFFERALHVRRGLPGTSQIETLSEMCEVHRLRGRYADAERYGNRALTLLERGEPDVSVGMRLYVVLSELAIDRSRYRRAAEFARRALALARATGSAEVEGSALDVLGQASSAQGDVQAAREAWHRAVEIFRGRGQSRPVAALVRRLDAMDVG